MIIETKYSAGDKVWFIKDNKIRHQHIYDINRIEVSAKGVITTVYGLNSTGNFKEEELFKTKEELINSIS